MGVRVTPGLWRTRARIRRLLKSGAELPLLHEKLLKEFRCRWLNDDGVQWHFHLVGATPPTIASFQPDAAERGDDRLEVSRYAGAFAIVMAAERVNPPLSIGIFGDWGSGESFFMRLMSKETDKISKIGDTDAEGRRLFCQRVVPIRFNAWHYAKGNLWASQVAQCSSDQFSDYRTVQRLSRGEANQPQHRLRRQRLPRPAARDA
jgi:KAP family P-loop domain